MTRKKKIMACMCVSEIWIGLPYGEFNEYILQYYTFRVSRLSVSTRMEIDVEKGHCSTVLNI